VTSSKQYVRPLLIFLTIGIIAVGLVPLATRANQQSFSLSPGDTLSISCETGLSGVVEGAKATIECAAKPAPSPTSAPAGSVIKQIVGVTEGQELSGRVAIEAKVADPSSIAQVEFYLDGPQKATHIEKSVPYFFMGNLKDGTPIGWDTSKFPGGAYKMTITAVTKGGQKATQAINFRVKSGAQPTTAPSATAKPTTAPSATAKPTTAPTATPMPSTGAKGICGESMEDWHPPVVNGPDGKPCQTGHEHGDAPPDWIAKAGYQVKFHGPFNTSPKENTDKHAAMKAFSAKFGSTDIYFRVHAASNPGDRSSRYHSYQVWARDSSGAVSQWQLWYNSGDPRPASEGGSRVPRRKNPGPEDQQRPIVAVVDEQSQKEGINCEQWYSAPGQPEWGWDFGWTICGATTLYRPDENNDPYNQSKWVVTGNPGTTRRLEASWYSFRQHPTGKFWSTQFGEIVSGPNDARCSQSTTKFGTEYKNLCLEQYIAPTLQTVGFPGNAMQKDFPSTGVKSPN
jgi:hypothetical protein